MTGKAAGAYSRRLTELDAWLKQPENRTALETAAAGTVTLLATAAVLRVLVSKTNTHTGISSATRDQIADATLMSLHMVGRALHALKVAGVMVQVYGGRKGADGKGRAAGRRVVFLTGDNPDETATSAQSGGYQRAVGGLSARSQVRTITEASATENITTVAKVSAENETEKGKGAHSEPDWSSLVVSAITQQIVSEASGIDNPDGFRHYTQSKVRRAVYAVETGYGAGIRQISPATYGWSDLVMVVKCRLSGEAVSRATSEALQNTADTALTC